MKNLNKEDKELQKIIFESENPAYLGGDAEIYEKIKIALKEQPVFGLGNDFAVSVTKEAIRKKAFLSTVRAAIFRAVLTSFIVLVGAMAFYFISKEVFSELAHIMFAYKYQLLFVVILLAGIQIIDRILLNKQFGNKITELI